MSLALTERMESELATVPDFWADAGPHDGRTVRALERRGLVETRPAERRVDVRGLPPGFTQTERYQQVRRTIDGRAYARRMAERSEA